ncbi:MAG: DUF2148 domain-containing protein [Tannerella sp.]|jgi:uncharacterized ferredoxin-like protein|nr:DUF2148 domain-containing protein [Tannerella sp.]
MIQNERDIRKELALQAARQMMVAARTAPKGKGIDIIEIALATDDDIRRMSDEMLKISAETGMKFFLRDADNILQSDVVMILGTRRKPQGLNCFHCGYKTCESKPAEAPCALNTVDLGIAVGSACAKASDLRVDTRVMFSAGLAAQHLEMLGKDCGCVMAIPVSATSKNPFFDRKPKQPETQERIASTDGALPIFLQ